MVLRLEQQRLLRQYLYICTSNTSTLRKRSRAGFQDAPLSSETPGAAQVSVFVLVYQKSKQTGCTSRRNVSSVTRCRTLTSGSCCVSILYFCTSKASKLSASARIDCGNSGHAGVPSLPGPCQPRRPPRFPIPPSPSAASYSLQPAQENPKALVRYFST